MIINSVFLSYFRYVNIYIYIYTKQKHLSEAQLVKIVTFNNGYNVIYSALVETRLQYTEIIHNTKW